ncbi:winged helix-turn-helix domain-containing protein [Streptomycetaceae bacterium NBC_01309]
MRFGVLGPLEVWTADGRPVRVPELKVRVLLAALLAERGRAVSADALVDHLWGDALPANPANALQAKVSQLRRALDEANPGARDLVVSRRPGYLLAADGTRPDGTRLGDPDAATLDADAFAALVARARETDDPRTRAALLTDALALWRGNALADFGDLPFARAWADRLEEERLTALEERAEARLALGEHRLLVAELAALAARHPLRERLHAAHLRALYGAGRQSEALDGFRELRARLADELGVDPGPELLALHQAILEQDPALDPPQAVDRPPRRRTNLPTSLTTLVGRDQAVGEVGALLAAGRLVTLTGPAGVGKTRLALATAAQRSPEAFPDGVWLVELAGRLPSMECVCDVFDIAEVIAAVLDLRDDIRENLKGAIGRSGVSVVDRLATALRGRKLLLVLDNCEHVIQPAAEVVAALLHSAPGLTVLATSQEPLAVPGEAQWPVPPLSLPAPLPRGRGGGAGGLPRPSDPGAANGSGASTGSSAPGATAAADGPDGSAARGGGPASDTDLRTMAEAGAVRLFLDRAAAAAPGFALDAGTAPAVATIVRRLDGIPLALELAATRVRALGVHELAARLDDRFRVLATGQRGGPARQQTLRAAIDWSWDLLGGPERAVLRRLAVHADGCTLDAAEAVCAGGEVASADVADVLARLVDRSLVAVTSHGAARPRYRLLESVAEYCLERLREADEFAAAAARHHRYFADLAVRAEPYLRGPEQRRWLELLDAENANLRRAVEHAAAHGDAAGALRPAAAATWSWYLRGRPREACRVLDIALAASGDAPAALRTRAVVLRAAVAMASDIDPSGLGTAREALAALDGAALDADSARDVAYAELLLATAFWWYGDSSDSRAFVRHALAALRALGDQWGIAAALSLTAYEAQIDGDLAACRRYAEESHRLFTRLGDRWGVLRAGDTLGALAEVRGDYAEAAGIARDGLRIAEELGLWAEYSGRLALLGRYALLGGDFADADAFHERALRMAYDLDDETAAMFAELGLALAARRQGRYADAERILLPWLDWSRAYDGPPGVAITAAELGFIAELRGDAETAAAYHREGVAAARRVGDPRMLALGYEGLAGASVLAGDAARGAALLGAAHRARVSTGHALAPAERADVERIESAARKVLGADAYEAAFQAAFEGGVWAEDGGGADGP